MINVELKGDVRQFEAGVSAADVAKSIGMGLYKSTCAAKVNGEVCDLRTALNEDCTLEILTFEDEGGKHAFWHTASHLLAQAVIREERSLTLLTDVYSTLYQLDAQTRTMDLSRVADRGEREVAVRELLETAAKELNL